MEKIIIELSTFITAVSVIIVALNKLFNKKIEPICKSINKLDEHHCKDFLVNFLTKKKNGEVISQTETLRAYDVYDHYTNDLHCNSYIHDEWEKYMN